MIRNLDDFRDIENSEENDQSIQKRLESRNLLDDQMTMQYSQHTNYPKVIMHICLKASMVEVLYDNKRIQLKPFYLDKFGCPDIGFERGQQLFLNEEKYGRVMDLILLGDFSFYIKEKREILDEMNLNNLNNMDILNGLNSLNNLLNLNL